MQTTVDRFGRIVIPKAVRDELALNPGTAFSIEERGGEIVLRPTWEEPALRRKDGLLLFSGQATGNLLEAVDEARRERAAKLSMNRVNS